MTCIREGCDRPVRVMSKPTLYCSDECRLHVKRVRERVARLTRLPSQGKAGGAANPFDTGHVSVRTPEKIAKGMAYLNSSMLTHCECGGLLAQSDKGVVFCLRCEPVPAEIVHGGRLR